MSEPGPKSDPRFRPFRAAAWAVYLVFAVTLSGLVIVSVARSVAAMSPPRPTTQGASLGEAECRAEAHRLFADLEAHRQQFAGAAEVRRVDAEWTRFRREWMNALRAVEGRCGVAEAGREPLAALFGQLERVADLYTTHAVQFAGEVGPSLDALKRQLGDGGR